MHGFRNTGAYGTCLLLFDHWTQSRASFLSEVRSVCSVPCEKDAGLPGRGEESALDQRKVAVVFCEQLHPGLTSTWRSAGLGHEKQKDVFTSGVQLAVFKDLQ